MAGESEKPRTARARARAENVEPVFKFIAANPGMAATLLVVVLALLKLGAVTRYDPTTMVAVASSVGPTSVIMSTVFSPPWPFVLVMATMSLRWVLIARSPHLVTRVAVFVFFVILLVLLLPLSGIGFVLAAALLILFVVWIVKERRRGSVAENRMQMINSATLVSLLLIIWSTFFNGFMWLPKEVILVESKTGEQAIFEGYVLSDEGQWTDLLQSGIRQIARIGTADMRIRVVCRHHESHRVWWADLTLLDPITPDLAPPPEDCKNVKADMEEDYPSADLPIYDQLRESGEAIAK